VTAEDPGDGGKSLGIVESGNPVPTNRIAADLGRSRDATLTNLGRLEAGNYIERSAAVGHAYEYKVQLLTE
jgi:biotin operon repressor